MNRLRSRHIYQIARSRQGGRLSEEEDTIPRIRLASPRTIRGTT